MPVVYKLDIYLVALVILVIIGTVTFEYVEQWSFVDSFYFSIVTLATVGYGDHYPITVAGKLFTSVYIAVGVTIFLLFVNELSRYIHNEK
jgi:hypothetical protein